MAEPLNTGLSAQQVLTAFNRALNDYTGAEIDALLGAKQDSIADLATIRSGAAAGATAVQQTAFETDQARQETEIGVVANAGAKNLFKNEKNAGASVVRQGATWVFDQTSVEANVSGSVSDTWSDVYLLNSSLDLSDKEYKIVIESDSPNIFMYIPGNTLSGGNIPSNGQYYPGVYKYKGIMTTSTRFTAKTASYSNNNIRCMICPASITDSTFQPYAKTNRELTVAEDEDRTALIGQVDGGAKNLLKITASSGVLNTATVNIADDSSIHISGQPTSNGAYVISSGIELTIPSDTYIMSVGSEAGNTRMSLSLRKKGTTQYVDLYMAERRIIPAGTYDRAHIYLYADTVYDIHIYPMICTAADYAISPAFVPYRPSWQEMYDMIKAMQNGV